MSDRVRNFDAIVVGSGISGGWAAKELCEQGLKTLVLERGKEVKHGDYPTAHLDKWDLPNRGHLTAEFRHDNPVLSRAPIVTEENQHFYVKDAEHPYDEVQGFNWSRGYQTGGRSITWGRQTYRLSDLDFEANSKDGYGVDWPIRYNDIEKWYDHVEEFIGVSGQALGLDQLPDGKFLPPMDLNCVEEHLKESIESNFEDRYLTIGRAAHLTVPHKGRGKCQFRNRCDRGCPYGAYFSSVSSTLPAAEATGNLSVRSDSVVASIIYDEKKEKAVGVRVLDRVTHEELEFYARVIFLNASALASTFILLNSKSKRFPNGLGNDSDQLGRNLMDHTFLAGANGTFDGFHDRYFEGRRPNGIYIPRFRNLKEGEQMKEFVRGYGFQGFAARDGWQAKQDSEEFGADFKNSLLKPGKWFFTMTGFGECLPYSDNRVTLHGSKTDQWGLPQLSFDATFRTNELAMRKDMIATAVEMLETAGFKDVHPYDYSPPVGSAIHEMGTARMGRDPKTSVLNKWNQVHAAPNVFVTDGACMTSSACQNPSLTYMALTARAANHAASEFKLGNL